MSESIPILTEKDPLEVKLVFGVRSCRTCKFFFPDKKPKPYGPFASFDFDTNTPKTNTPPNQSGEKYPKPWKWVKGTTSEQAFPNPEVMDGCRKAPIMTIGINPNLTAFAPGQQGTSWCYPSFTSNGGTDAWTKYAYYYRYRTVYQECMDLDFAEQYLVKGSEIPAAKAGKMVSAKRTSDLSQFEIVVRYDGDSKDTTIPVSWDLGKPRYVVLYNSFSHNNTFESGATIAAQLDVPPGISVEINHQQIGYYEQFVPVLNEFKSFLEKKGQTDVKLEMGEDVCQLDMVACASPHWNPAYMGGSQESEDTVIYDCVSDRMWAMKQFVQTMPAALFLVGESTYNMFNDAFGNYIVCDPPIPEHLEDNAFTLLKATTEGKCYFKYSGEFDGKPFNINTRLVASPHFSYNSNFVPQFRMSQSDWSSFEKNYSDCYTYLEQLASSKEITITVPDNDYGFVAVTINTDATAFFNGLKNQEAAKAVLMKWYISAHTAMANVLETLYNDGDLSYTKGTKDQPGYLTRGSNGCKFCVNEHWSFPKGCPYNKIDEPAPSAKLLGKVAAALVAGGKPTKSK
jgi:hypothetical protein